MSSTSRPSATTDSSSATRASVTMAALLTDSGDDGEVPMCAVPGGRAGGPECETMVCGDHFRLPAGRH